MNGLSTDLALINVVSTISKTGLSLFYNYYISTRSITKRVYSQFCIETIHGRLKRKRKFSGLFARISFRPTCCPQGKRRSNHEINPYVYLP